MKAWGIFLCVGSLVLFGCASGQTRTSEAPSLKLSFIIDRQYDEGNIVWMFRHDDPAGLASRAASMGVEVDIARRIRDAADLSVARELAHSIVNDRFNEKGTAIEASRKDFEIQWKDLLPLFSKIVVETTESPWVHPDYVCVVSSIFPGLSSWSGNKVAVKFDYDSVYERRMLAHEILLSDVFQLLRRHYSSSEISDWQVWAFSEITPDLMLDDPRLVGFWPDFPHAGEYSGYPQLAGLERRLRELFDHRTSYADYEQKAAAVLKAFNNAFSLHRPKLGISYGDLTPELRSRLQGVMVKDVYKGTPAFAAGVLAGDIIVGVNGNKVEDAWEFAGIVADLPANGVCDLVVHRDGEEMELRLLF